MMRQQLVGFDINMIARNTFLYLPALGRSSFPGSSIEFPMFIAIDSVDYLQPSSQSCYVRTAIFLVQLSSSSIFSIGSVRADFFSCVFLYLVTVAVNYIIFLSLTVVRCIFCATFPCCVFHYFTLLPTLIFPRLNCLILHSCFY